MGKRSEELAAEAERLSLEASLAYEEERREEDARYKRQIAEEKAAREREDAERERQERAELARAVAGIKTPEQLEAEERARREDQERIEAMLARLPSRESMPPCIHCGAHMRFSELPPVMEFKPVWSGGESESFTMLLCPQCGWGTKAKFESPFPWLIFE